MPSTYAHDRFGARVLEQLPGDVRGVIEPHRSLYDVGLQGPDILFHYKALSKNEINRMGHEMHLWSGKRFFGLLLPKAQSDAAKAYLYGLMCHFALDSACHGAVNAIAQRTQTHHFDVETELERQLMLLDGRDPVKHRPAEHFAASEALGRVMADFFGITARQARDSVKGMRRNIGLLVPRSAVWSGLVGTILKAVHADTFYRLMIPRCAPSGLAGEVPQLIALGAQAEGIARMLITDAAQGKLEHAQLRKNFAKGEEQEDEA